MAAPRASPTSVQRFAGKSATKRTNRDRLSNSGVSKFKTHSRSTPSSGPIANSETRPRIAVVANATRRRSRRSEASGRVRTNAGRCEPPPSTIQSSAQPGLASTTMCRPVRPHARPLVPCPCNASQAQEPTYIARLSARRSPPLARRSDRIGPLAAKLCGCAQ